MKRIASVALFVLAWPMAAQGPADGAAARAADDVLAELLAKKDDADIKLVEQLAKEGTRQAAEGLIKVYDAVTTLYFRREIVRALGIVGSNEAAANVALPKLALIIGNETEDELRLAAVKALGSCPGANKPLLKQLVDAEIDDRYRELALREHVKQATAADGPWYRFLWNLKGEQRKDAAGNIVALELSAVRELAFTGVAPFLTEDELVEALRRETVPKIRRAALLTMHGRNLPKTSEMAVWAMERVDFPGVDRAEAARILVERDGPKSVPVMFELAKKRDVTPEDLRVEMARLIAAMKDDATDKKVGKMVGKGKPHEQVFALYCASRIDDPKVKAAVRKELQDKSPEVRRAAAKVVALRQDRDALPELQAMLSKPKNPGDARLAIEAISGIDGTAAKWREELVALAANADTDIRNAALEQLALAQSRKFLPVLTTALSHADWSTRLVAIDGLLALRDKESIPKLIDRLEHEHGRLGRRIADVLWQLTAQPFEQDFEKWRAWWTESAPKFQVVTEAELDKATKARELKRLQARTVTKAKFFGLQIESHRVIFIIDISGSMLESLYGHTIGKRAAARIDYAKQELSQAITNLEEGTQFNILAFSNGVARWQKEGIGTSNAQNREAALEWVDRLGAAGGTNLYDSVQMAFEDPDVDTIFIMSDGEPTVGQVIDPHRIREDVAFWNKHRKIKINTIVIGGNLEILEWLSKDAGGKHTQIR